MSDPENFVARWSRLKRDTAAKEKAEAARPDDADATVAEPREEHAPTDVEGPGQARFDTASLPPIESITAASDIRAFLQSGVPAELTKAALRRVWTTDPAIRDFIGIAENQWDFTNPTAMPGFGPLEATDDVRELVAQAMGKLGQALDPSAEATGQFDRGNATSAPGAELSQVAGMPVENKPKAEGGNMASSVQVQTSSVDIAPHHDDNPALDGVLPSRRTHGRALPQ